MEDRKTTTYIYTYDALGRLVSMQEKNNDGYVLLVSNSYNDNNQLSRTLYKVGGALYSQSYTYNAADGSINTVTMPDTKKLTMGYDSLRRLSTVTGGVTAKRYLYRTFADNTTTNQVTSLTYTGLNQAFQYTYDIRGNIATYAEPGKAVVSYTYDKQGQLLSATSNTNSYSYTYDNVGNILTATKNGTKHTYTYSTYDWKDKLVAYDGLAIAYDASGNPTSYYNGTRWNMTWENGRELATATSGNTSLAFTYDGDGIRTSKTVNGVEHKYYYSGSKLLRETYGNNILDFAYNADGSLYSFRHNGTYYYYVTNLQGDVIGLVDANGTVVASYEYDPYGDVLSDEDIPVNSIAAINPMRYRGYYYDAETGFYYLQSRYYDPEIGRFINADVLASTGQGILGNNMFAYCGNNPVHRIDVNGYAWETIFDVISLGFSIAEVAANPYDPMSWVGLIGDAVDLIPFVSGVGETVRGLRFVDKAGDVLEIAESTDGAIDTYRSLRKLSKGTGNEVHHIVEKRFIRSLDFDNTNDMLSITLSKADHRKFTNLWREQLNYGRKSTTKFDIFQAAANIYKDEPQLMGAVVQTIFK